MSLLEKDSVHQADHALGIIPDTNDPTAGQVAISRELASEQVRMIADPSPLGLGAFALTTFLLIAALRTTLVLAVLFAILDVAFYLLSFGALASNPDLTKFGGILGIAAAAVAWYLCLAGVIASTFGRAILPNRPLFRG